MRSLYSSSVMSPQKFGVMVNPWYEDKDPNEVMLDRDREGVVEMELKEHIAEGYEIVKEPVEAPWFSRMTPMGTATGAAMFVPLKRDD